MVKNFLRKIKCSLHLLKFLSDKNIHQLNNLLNTYSQKFAKNALNSSILIFDTTKVEPIVSVVTPAYNASVFLPLVAQSLSEQSLADRIQWIVVDDGSDDNTNELLSNLSKKYKQMGIKYLRNRFNGGATFCLRQGFNVSDAPYVAWVSADDYYIDRRKLEKDIEMLKTGFDFVFSKYNLFGESPKMSKKIETFFSSSGDELFADITYSNNINGSSFVIKKQVYENVGGFDDILLNVDGDYDLFSRLILCGYKIGLSNSTSFVTLRGDQVSKQSLLMKFGTSVSRGRFLYVPEIRRFLLNKFLENPIRFYRLSYGSPFFVLELMHLSSQPTALCLIADMRGEIFENFLRAYRNFVKFATGTEAYKRFIDVFYKAREKKVV